MKKLSFVVFFLSFLLLGQMTAFAAFAGPCPSGQINNGTECVTAPAAGSTAAPAATTGTSLFNPLGASTTISGFIGKVIGGIMGLVGTAALAMFVWGGIQYLISQGSPDKLKKAKDTLIYASLGLMVIFTSYTLVSALVNVLSKGSVE